jgi:hypothetical protein
MLLTFDRRLVERLMEHTRKAPRHPPLYNVQKTARPGLLLVGDQGIYLMSNGEPPLKGETTANLVVYADQANPDELPFEQWWEAKNRAFGGDDGGEFLELKNLEECLATYKQDEPLQIDLTPEQIAIIKYEKKRKNTKER